jgi:hypothetical protein
MEAHFTPLGPHEPPERGLFFIERPEVLANDHRSNLDPNLPRAPGMAFLVHASGLLATASHVPLRIGARPGSRVLVLGANSDLPIEAEAEVLAAGWTGPLTEEGFALPMSPFFDGVVDERPDVFRQDLCFLRLILETTRMHPRGFSGWVGGGGRECLLENARVLPLGATNARSRGCHTTSWVVVWERGGPACHAATAELHGLEPGLHDAVRLESPHISYGFSGSPVWDPHRRLVLGVIRRGVFSLPGTVIATDARAVVRAHEQLALGCDRRLQPFLDFAGRDAVRGFTRLHESIHWGAEDLLVPQEGSLWSPQQPASGTEQRFPILPQLVEWICAGSGQTFLIEGAAGAGKSTLLRSVACALRSSPAADRFFVLAPVVVSARELVQAGFELRKVLDALWATLQSHGEAGVDIIELLHENDARIVLMIDALDEVSREAAGRLWSIFARRKMHRAQDEVTNGLVLHCVFTSRSTEDAHAVADRARGLTRVLLHPLGSELAQSLGRKLLRDLDEAAGRRFETGLNDLRVLTNGLTPLQVWMAVVIFRQEGRLPKRPLDLVHEFVTILMADTAKDVERKAGLRRGKRVMNEYLPDLKHVLALLAHASRRRRDEGLGEAALFDELKAAGLACPSAWLEDPGDLLRFVFEDLPAACGLLQVRVMTPDAQLEWTHASFQDYFAARYVLDYSPSEGAARTALVMDNITHNDHWFALNILTEMERQQEFAAVHRTLSECLSRPASIKRPRLLALRALALGIDADGRSRPMQVRALLAAFVSEFSERMSCAAVFTLEGLPDPDEILARSDLREDLLQALEERFATRIKFARPGRPPRLLKNELTVIDKASLWCEMEALGLQRPTVSGMLLPVRSFGKLPRAGSAAPPNPASGDARLLLRAVDGQLSEVCMPSLQFADYLVQAARALPTSSSTEIVALVADWAIEQSRFMTPGGSDKSQH